MLAYFKRLFDYVYVKGTAQAGASTTITLVSTASAVDNFYVGSSIFLVDGTGAGQNRLITSYNGTTKVATIEKDWETNPDNTSVYLLIGMPGIANLLGKYTDTITVPYVFGDNSILAHLNTLFYHVHGQSFVYPNHANDVTLTAGNGAWNTGGTITEVIPEGALSAAFDLHWINVSAISGNAEIQIDIYSGALGEEVQIGATKTHRNAVQSSEGSKRVQIPPQAANTRISCKLSDSTAGALTCAVSFEGHYYM